MAALHRVEGLRGASLVDVHGFGRGGADAHEEVEEDLGAVRHTRIEVYCDDGLVEAIVTAVETAAHTGLRGDGKIYVSPVEQAVRISTGERGEAAV